MTNTQFSSERSGRSNRRRSSHVRTDPPDELGGTAERAKASSPVVGHRSTGNVANAPSAVPPDEFGGSYESECRPRRPYGAVKKVLAVVIGRAGSRGLPGKNALLLAGRPLICHTIDDARAASTVDRVVVSTDGDAIAAAAESMAVPVVRRPPDLATDTAPVAAAVRHAVAEHDAAGVASIIVILYANVPVRPPGLIDRAVGLLLETGADSVQSYCAVGKHHPYWMVALDGLNRVTPFHDNPVDRRQDLPSLLIPDGGVIAVTRASLMSAASDPAHDHPHAFLGADRRGVETAPGEVIDVDTARDLVVAGAFMDRAIAGGVG